MSRFLGKTEVEVPRFISDCVINGETSLGDNPAFPSSRGNNIILDMVASRIAKVDEAVGGITPEAATKELTGLLTECAKHEGKCREALEQLCADCVTNTISIPDDTIKLDMSLVGKVDMSGHRMLPDSEDDYTFESIDDMSGMEGEIYKRRFINAMVCGAAYFYGNDIQSYVAELFKIDPDLPAMYKRITALNEYLLYHDGDGEPSCEGKVDVNIGDESDKVRISAEGTFFPSLLTETYRGIFELAASHGLPDDIDRAKYVMSRSDYTSAELWDLRIGSVIWDTVISQIDGVEPQFIIMKLSECPVEEFNGYMREIIACTKRGKEILDAIAENVMDEIDRDDFDQYMDSQRDKYQLSDGYMTSEELLSDCIPRF